MRFTLSYVLMLLVAACGRTRKTVRPHALEPGRAYEAIHELRLRTTGKTPDDQPFRRDVIRRETYVDHFLTTQRAQRVYDVYEVTEEMAIGADRDATVLDPEVLGIRITLLFDKGIWSTPKEAPDEIRALIGERTLVGPPRFWAGTSTKWRTFQNEPLLTFLGLGKFKKGLMRAKFERWGKHEGAQNALITLEIEEHWERGKAVAKGWMIFDLEWAMIAKVALNGKITPTGGKPELFQATRTWSPVDKAP